MAKDADSAALWDAFSQELEAALKRYYLQLLQTAYSDAEMLSGVAIPFDTSQPAIHSALDSLRQRTGAIVEQVRAGGNAQERAGLIAAQETEYIYSLGQRAAYEQIGLTVDKQ